MKADKLQERYQILLNVKEFSQRRKYRWLENNNFLWLIGVQKNSGKISYTENQKKLNQGFLNAQEMGDLYLSEKFLSNLVYFSDFLKQKKRTLNYLHKLLKSSGKSQTSLLQTVRNYSISNRILYKNSQKRLAKAVALEGLFYAKKLKMIFI